MAKKRCKFACASRKVASEEWQRERERGVARRAMRDVAVTVAFYEIINMYALNGLKSAMAH